MKKIIFKVGGALSEEDSDVYVERPSDTEALHCVRGMDYLLVIEPRQQGKTSLLAWLKRSISTDNSVFVYVDVSGLSYDTEALWSKDLWERTSSQLESKLDVTSATVSCAQDLEKAWRQTAILAQKQSLKVIIALDEVGSLAKAVWSEQFFTRLRVFFNERAFACTYWKYVTFIMVGAFHPRDLIQDNTISPFNIAKRIHLRDFDREQVYELVSKGNWSKPQVKMLAERIYHWTNGQPYLTQWLCSYLSSFVEANDQDVDAAVERLRRDDSNHIPPILERLSKQEQLSQYVYRVLSGEHIKYYPGENKRQAQLELLGLIKQDKEGNCIIRNQIYKNILTDLKLTSAASSRLPELPLQKQDKPIEKKVKRGNQGKNNSTETVLRFQLQLGYLNGNKFQTRVLDSPMGPRLGDGILPNTPEELIVILKALQTTSFAEGSFSSIQQEMLEQLGLLTNSNFVHDLLKRIGQSLYKGLFADSKVRSAFDGTTNLAQQPNHMVSFQLRFDEDAAELARYPWELIWDEDHALLPKQKVALTRYITHAHPTVPLTAHPPLRLLYITARPQANDLNQLNDNEYQSIRQALQPLEQENRILIDHLSKPTWDTLQDYVDVHSPHILHFDGHGRFNRQCHICHTFYHSHITQCTNCGIPLPEPQGYLAFEKEDGTADWVDSHTLGYLFGSNLRLAVLSACHSGTVRGESLFGGVGPALIQAGVPAVVATQLPITVDSANQFAKGFYSALARYESLTAAVNTGRRRLFNTKEWFIPILYLRSTDDEGHLFTQPKEKHHE